MGMGRYRQVEWERPCSRETHLRVIKWWFREASYSQSKSETKRLDERDWSKGKIKKAGGKVKGCNYAGEGGANIRNWISSDCDEYKTH